MDALANSNLDQGWTDWRIKTMTEMWAEGYSDSQIAAAIGGGLSRNAVIGKRTRLGLPLRGHIRPHKLLVRKIGSLRVRPKVERRGGVRPALLKPWEQATGEMADLPPEQSPCAVGLMALTEHTCRWPVGEETGADQMFCGAEPTTGYSYCPRHCRMSYRPAGRSEAA